MPWNTGGGNSGGPWGGNGPSGNSNSPWGNGPRNNGRGPGQQPPNLDDLLRKGQDRMRGLFPNGMNGPRAVILGLCIIIAAWALTGFYKVQPDEQGVEMLFGRYVKTTEPGLHYWFPTPIGNVENVGVTKIRQITFGNQSDTPQRFPTPSGSASEREILTSDQNVVDADYAVFWRVSDAEAFLFNIRDPEETVRRAAESAMREVAGQSSLDQLMTNSKEALQGEVMLRLQKLLDDYQAGVEITGVKLLAVDPPQQVIEAFHDVNNARQDLDRQRNEALAYRNDILPRAKGQAEKIEQDAMAYKERQIKDAQGEAKRFLSMEETYRSAETITRERMYLETMQDILGKANKIVIDDKAGKGVVPYLPLPEVRKHTTTGETKGAGK